MYLSLNWLKDFVNIPRSLSPEDLGLKLTMHTVEIDGVEEQKEKFKNIVVGEILEIKKHPRADRLQLVKVNVKKEILKIVCGAANIKPGQLVPVALTGASLPNGLEIKETEIRGEKSSGMLLAEDELGLGSNHAGIMVLKKAKIGQNFGEYLKLDDVIYEVDNKSVTNRPDLWGHYGMAREIAAFLGVKFHGLNIKNLNAPNQEFKLNVKIEDFKSCPRYMAVVINNVKIEESPKWLRERLIAVGMRPINNIVDITNYVMLELGQPLHAFDASLVLLENKEREVGIVIRQAKDKEVIETLDGEKRELDNSMLVIADKKKPVAVAGVMGGANSEIGDVSTSIIIESANFDPVSIRKTAQKLGLRTEASKRFEKSLDPFLCEMALARTAELIKKVCPKTKIASKIIDEKKFKLNQGPIRLDLNWLSKRIGQEIDKEKVFSILENLGFILKIDVKNPKIVEVTVPTWRATKDISIPEDLMEEVARIHGYDNLNPQMPKVTMKTPRINKERNFERRIKNVLSNSARLTEVYNYSFVGEEYLTKLNIDYSNYIKLANPISNEHAMLRQSLVPNMLLNVKINQAKYEKISLFEIGNVYFNFAGENAKSDKKEENLPYQEKRIGIILAGDKNNLDKIKGMLKLLNSGINFETAEDYPAWAKKNICAKIVNKNKEIGLVAKIDSQVLKKIGIKKEVVVAEIFFQELFDLFNDKKEQKLYQKMPKYPPVVRDLAFVVSSKILYNDIKKEIESFDNLIRGVELFDVYQGSRVGREKKNLAFHINYQSLDRTLVSEEVDALQDKLIKRMQEKFEAQIRDF